MKKLRLSLIVAFLGVISLLGAQNAFISVKGGLNMSNFYGSKLTDKKMNPGFHIGVEADVEFMTNVSLQTGLFFTTKGAKYSYEVPVVENVDYTVNSNYLQLPLHIAYKIDVTPSTKIVIHAGPYVAYGIGGKRKIESQYSADLDNIFGKQEINTFDKKFGYKPFDYGVGVGVGADFGIIIIDLGWDMGLNNIARGINVGGTEYKQNIKNQSAHLSIGYKF